MRKLMLVFAAVLIIPLAAAAQESPAAAAENAALPGYMGYDFSDYGFYIDLPEHGSINFPNSPGWSETDDTVFVWQPTDDNPVLRIDLIRQQFDSELSSEDLESYLGVLIEEFRNSPGVSVLDSSRAYDDGLFAWNVIDLQHNLNEGLVYSSTYVTLDFDTIYAVSFYSVDAGTEQIAQTAAGVFNGFVPSIYASLLGEPQEYVSADYGFSLLLPATGYIATPENGNWQEAPEVEAVWFSTGADPIESIRIGVFEHTEDYTRQMIDDVIDSYISAMVGDSQSTNVVQEESYVVGEQSWDHVEIAVTEDPTSPLYLTLYVTTRGPRLYMLLGTHFAPLSAEHTNFMYPVLDSLRVE